MAQDKCDVLPVYLVTFKEITVDRVQQHTVGYKKTKIYLDTLLTSYLQIILICAVQYSKTLLSSALLASQAFSWAHWTQWEQWKGLKKG